MKTKKVLNWVSPILAIAVNALANIIPLNGQTTGDISNAIPTLFTPAGYVFSIWTLIYLGLLSFAWYQSQRAGEELLERIGYWFVLSNFFNGAWIVAWHYEQFALSLGLMLGLLVSLLAIYLRVGIGTRAVSVAERRWTHLPFSTYLGWISVATVANVSVVLYEAGWNGGPLSPAAWTAIMVLIAAVLGVAMAIIRHDVAYPLVIIWSVTGIAVARGDSPLVRGSSWAAAALVAITVLWTTLRRRRTS